jgi:undecaprenyl-phosphate 4-deoxy-4-formamido-L-arabinose transferase
MIELKSSAERTHNSKLSVVIPVYRSEACLVALNDAIKEAMTFAEQEYEVIFVNDYSPDHSWWTIESLCRDDARVTGIDLRRNFGQDNAILTGLRVATGKYIAIMDDDLQHHPKFLKELLTELDQGYDVVYANFERKQQRLWKNVGSWINGKIAEWVLEKPKGLYLSPYKVMTHEIAKLICDYPGHAPYIDGLLFQSTARIGQVSVAHHPRFQGDGNYTLGRSIGVSARLAFSFSARPLRMIGVFGVSTSGLGLALALLVVAYRLLFPQHFTPEAVGWASLMVVILVVAGLQMIFFGALAEYTGRSYLLMSRKPQTSIREILNLKSDCTPDTSSVERYVEEVSIGARSDLQKLNNL